MPEPQARVFVVDDGASVREAVDSLTRSVGLRVETFASVQEFLACPRADMPSCGVILIQASSAAQCSGKVAVLSNSPP